MDRCGQRLGVFFCMRGNIGRNIRSTDCICPTCTSGQVGMGGYRRTWASSRGRLRAVSWPPCHLLRAGAEMIPERILADLDRVIAESPQEQLPALLATLSARLALVASKIMASSPRNTGSSESLQGNLSVGEAAARLGISQDYLYRNARKLPFSLRIGRRLLFSASGLEKWVAQRREGIS